MRRREKPMSRIIITAEDIQNAKDYIPAVHRQELLESIAPKCIVKVRTSYIPTGETESVPIPDRFQEYGMLTNLFLMGVLAVEYLNKPFDGCEESLQMPANLYDEWAGSHVLSQIEALRSDKAVHDKACYILQDFYAFRTALYREIETNLGHQNDIVWRLLDAFKGFILENVTGALEGQTGGKDEELTDEEKIDRIVEANQKIDESIERLESIKAEVKRRMDALKEDAKAAKEVSGDG